MSLPSSVFFHTLLLFSVETFSRNSQSNTVLNMYEVNIKDPQRFHCHLHGWSPSFIYPERVLLEINWLNMSLDGAYLL